MHKKFRIKTSGRIQAIIENRAKDAMVKSKSKTFANREEAEGCVGGNGKTVPAS